MDNPKRTGDIWLLAANEGDSRYKSAVQQLIFVFLIGIQRETPILFPGIEDVREGVESVSLKLFLIVDCPYIIYVKEGPDTEITR